MTNKKEIYKCEICGNIVEVVHEGAGQLVCCNQPMVLQEEKNADQGLEKHVPVIEENGNTVTVKVGDVPHPMERRTLHRMDRISRRWSIQKKSS